MDNLLPFSFQLYHDTVGQSAGPPPSYATDPTGIYVLLVGVVAVAGLMIYFHNKNKQEEAKKRGKKPAKKSSKRRSK